MLSRTLINRCTTGATAAAFLISLSVVMALLTAICLKGASALSFEFLFSPARDFGASGGIVYQISGSLLLVFVSALLVTPIALGAAIFIAEDGSHSGHQSFLTTALLSLNAIPSITFGLFGLILFVNILGTGISWFVGSVILAMMMLPTVTLATLQSMQSLPQDFKENAQALGLTHSQIIVHVVIPQSLHGLVTGLLIGLARAIGETAPIMFIATAFSGVTFPKSILEPVSTLPTHILALAQQATNPDALRNAWGTSLVLMLIVLGFSLSALLARRTLSSFRQTS